MFSSLLTAILATISLFTSFVHAAPGQLTHVRDWGTKPTSVDMYIYEPRKLAPKPAIVVVIHYCLDMTFSYPESTKAYRTYAEKNGFLLIYPRTQRDSACWDVSSSESLKHDGGGDSHSIANMVRYALQKYSADPTKVFATGLSSGAMMTQALMATYPDLFAGGSAFAGVAAGCLKYNLQSGRVQGTGHSSPTSDHSGCPQGKMPAKSADYWVNLVKEAYPGYTGPRPKVQLWHGTADPIVSYKNLAEALKQWSTVLGVSYSKNITGVPEAGYTKLVYGDGTKLQGFSVAGAGHLLKIQPQTMFEFFGLI